MNIERYQIIIYLSQKENGDFQEVELRQWVVVIRNVIHVLRKEHYVYQDSRRIILPKYSTIICSVIIMWNRG